MTGKDAVGLRNHSVGVDRISVSQTLRWRRSTNHPRSKYGIGNAESPFLNDSSSVGSLICPGNRFCSFNLSTVFYTTTAYQTKSDQEWNFFLTCITTVRRCIHVFIFLIFKTVHQIKVNAIANVFADSMVSRLKREENAAAPSGSSAGKLGRRTAAAAAVAAAAKARMSDTVIPTWKWAQKLQAKVENLANQIARINNKKYMCQSGHMYYDEQQQAKRTITWRYPKQFLEEPAMVAIVKAYDFYTTNSTIYEACTRDVVEGSGTDSMSHTYTMSISCRSNKKDAFIVHVGEAITKKIIEVTVLSCGYVSTSRNMPRRRN